MGGQPIQDSRPPRPQLPTGPEALAKSLAQRIARLARFADELGGALRAEFGSLEGTVDAAASLLGRLALLEGQVARARRLLQEAPGRPAEDALRLLRAFDLEALTAAVKGLEAQAAQLREAPAALAAAPARPGLGGLLRRWLPPILVLEQPGPHASAPPARLPAPVERKKQAFVAASRFVAQVLAYVSPRLTLVTFSLEATGLPAQRLPWKSITRTLLPRAAAAGIEQTQMTWLKALVKLFYQDMIAVRKAHGATVQWRKAEEIDAAARHVERELATGSAERQAAMLAAFDVAKYRGAVFPLSHLHLTFRDVPTLQSLFPAQEAPQPG